MWGVLFRTHKTECISSFLRWEVFKFKTISTSFCRLLFFFHWFVNSFYFSSLFLTVPCCLGFISSLRRFYSPSLAFFSGLPFKISNFLPLWDDSFCDRVFGNERTAFRMKSSLRAQMHCLFPPTHESCCTHMLQNRHHVDNSIIICAYNIYNHIRVHRKSIKKLWKIILQVQKSGFSFCKMNAWR